MVISMHNPSHWEVGARESRTLLSYIKKFKTSQRYTRSYLEKKKPKTKHQKQKTGFLSRYPKEARRSLLTRHVRLR